MGSPDDGAPAEGKALLARVLQGCPTSGMLCYDFNGANVGTDTTAESFNSAVMMVIAALERGYHPN